MPRYFNTSLRNLTYRLRKFKDLLDEELKNVILENEDVIIQMVAENQLYEHGIEGRGIEIMSYQPYAPKTIRVKLRKGQPTDRVTLRDTGQFHESFHLEFDGDGFYIVSSDEKSKYLLKRYGDTILRITDENLKKLLREYIEPGLKQKLKEKIIYGRA